MSDGFITQEEKTISYMTMTDVQIAKTIAEVTTAEAGGDCEGTSLVSLTEVCIIHH